MERRIAVLTDVKDLSELLEGARVDRTRLEPSGTRLSLEMELTRACVETQPAGKGGLFSRPKTPWMKSRLTLRKIQEATVQRLSDTPPTGVPLLTCDAVPGGYALSVTSHDGLRVLLTLEQLDGQFIDLGAPAVANG